MPKNEKVRHNTTFHNFKMSETVFWSLRPEVGSDLLSIITQFVELSEEGAKVSFGAKKSSNGFSVAVTLPVTGSLDDSVCASFWAGDALEAWQTAYIATFEFKATKDGWEAAQERHDRYRDQMAADLREFIQSQRK